MNACARDYSITVASGTGEVNTKVADGATAHGVIHGLMTMVGVKAPAATPSAEYDLQVYDAAGYLLYAENDLIGDTTISLEKLCNSALRIVLSGASVDGSYAIRLYVRN
jgi:hypothetical protein